MEAWKTFARGGLCSVLLPWRDGKEESAREFRKVPLGVSFSQVGEEMGGRCAAAV